MVSVVQAVLSDGSLVPFDLPLMIASLEHGMSTELPGEEELYAELEHDLFAPASLERYADFLEANGYGSLARRTRALARR